MEEKKLLDINAKSGLERFIGDENLYREYLERFLYDGSFEEFCAAVAIADISMADQSLHTLMGTSANLSLERLHRSASDAATKIAAQETDLDVEAIVDELAEVYNDTCMAVRKYLGHE
ncbi:MAG: histidine kinase [Schwartzia sp.]|nr:histidine kinase [Schwartzia sp. (in: firmicutes)]